MNGCNFALISALYNNKQAGFYNDIYLPIIKYCIADVAAGMTEDKYYDCGSLQQNIKEIFGIQIPTIVIKSAIQKISKNEKPFSIEVYQSGDKFKIEKQWDVPLNNHIDDKIQFFTNKVKEIEEQFTKYKTKELATSEDTTFIKFISDNTEDIIGYFENSDEAKVTAEYVNMARFLQTLREIDKELFDTATELFWGSVIAGFLQSGKENIISGANATKTEYFLDTSLVMGILQLSNEETETYSNEIVDMLRAADCILRVHPMTIKEVNTIIESVKLNGEPNDINGLSDAWDRHKLNLTKLSRIQTKLTKTLESKQISVFPSYSDHDLQVQINEYGRKTTVKDLFRQRYGIENISQGKINFREIHDVFMDDYVANRNMQQSSSSETFFVTTNKDLVAFSRSRKKNTHLILAGRVILELWMHSAPVPSLKSSALTEAMARCMEFNNTDVKHKLIAVSKNYNENSEGFDPELYKLIIQELYKRAKNVITAVDDLSNETDKQAIATKTQTLLSEVKKNDQLHRESEKRYEKVSMQLKEENEQLKHSSKELSEKLKTKEGAIKLKDAKISELETLNAKTETSENNYRQKYLTSLQKEFDSITQLKSNIDVKVCKRVQFLKWTIIGLIVIGFVLFCLSMIFYDDFQVEKYVGVFSMGISFITTIIGMIIGESFNPIAFVHTTYKQREEKKLYKKFGVNVDRLKELEDEIQNMQQTQTKK